jgi:hypothetical protein
MNAYTYTPLFVLAAVPGILCAISRRLSAKSRFVALAVSSIGLALLIAWAGLMWLGLGLPVLKFQSVLG